MFKKIKDKKYFKFINVLLVILLLLTIILLSGCGQKPNCSQYNTKYKTYSYNEKTGQCVLIKSIPKNVCGNGIPEPGETYCNCPQDVSATNPQYGCSGSVGKYLVHKCDNNKKCGLFPNKSIVYITKDLTYLKDSYVFLDLKLTIQNPIIYNTEQNTKIKYDLSLFNVASSRSLNITNIHIDSIYLIDSSSNVYAEADLNKDLTLNNNLEGFLNIDEFNGFDIHKYLYLVVTLSYVKHFYNNGKEIKKETIKTRFKQSLGNWELINGRNAPQTNTSSNINQK